ncbi:hypothetical protein C9439_06470 [archaeon SCG-AAA382B04]|nr:hypothetical protein C9439_06470 [archaeon SCG-AAA382B04]
MELTSVQKEILNSLLNHYRGERGAVKGEKVAESIGRNPGTIRNQMQSLKALELIEGVPGPKGGYKPTSKAYKVLDYEDFDEGEPVEISRDSETIDNATAVEIDLTTLPQPDVCKASIKILGNVKTFDEGEVIEIGPTPVNEMYMKGVVSGRDEIGNKLIVQIKEIHSIPKKPVREVISRTLITLSKDDTIREAAKTFLKNDIDGGPVEENGEIIGIVTKTDLVKSVANSKLEKKVFEVMTKQPISIFIDSKLLEAMKKIKGNDISRLVVMDDEAVGVVTRTDLINSLYTSF